MTVYYVDTNNTSARDNNAGTKAAPWKTVQKAAEILKPGDTVYVKAGTYAPFHVEVSGAPGKEITFSAAPGDTHEVIIDGRLGDLRDTIHVVGESNLRIEGFRAIHAERAGIYIEGSTSGETRISIVNNEVETTGGAGIMAAGKNMGHYTRDTNRLTNVVIEKNDVSDTNTPNGRSEAISVGGGVDGIIVRENTVHDTDQFGINFKYGVQNGKIYDNLIYDVEKHGIYLDTASRYVRNVEIFNNEVYRNHNGIVMTRETSALDKVLEGIDIYNNLVYDNDRFGILAYRHIQDSLQTGAFSDVVIANNTVFRNGKTGIMLDQIEDLAKNFVVANNILYDNQLDIYNDIGAREVSNLVATEPGLLSTGPNPNLQLTPTSLAIDAANATFAPAVDHDGNPRPQGEANDIGAFEFIFSGEAPHVERELEGEGISRGSEDNSLVELWLVDAAKDTRAIELTDAAVVDRSVLSSDQFSVEAIVDGSLRARSVELEMTGYGIKVENFLPYVLFGDAGRGADYFGRDLLGGVRTLDVAVFSDEDAMGDILFETSLTIDIA